MSAGPNLDPVIDKPVQSVPKPLLIGSVVAIAAGIAGAAYAAGQESDRASIAFLHNMVHWLGVAQGGFMLSIALTMSKGRWGRPFKRMAEALALTVPLLYVGLLLFLYFGGMQLYLSLIHI